MINNSKSLNKNIYSKFFSKFFFWMTVSLLSIGFLVSCTLEREIIRPKKKFNLDDPVYYHLLGQKYYNEEEYEKSTFQYERLIKRFSVGEDAEKYSEDLAWAEYEIGFNYLVMEEYDEALFHFNRVRNSFNHPVARSFAIDRIQEINNLVNN